uniref:Uncharacterized protein n=1 Tax=Moniliophthora roreri TaxID=221103 RepID=A0A0W0FG05_MONRR
MAAPDFPISASAYETWVGRQGHIKAMIENSRGTITREKP